ncbi:EamA family transporter [Pseudoalteromonas piscicida]|uniref:EamA domain-containing protein n=1 Tax=Pseudoalteromonas piscicida TaxID=43662 RepID=A0A2A5JTD9_PSEO7|nr:EamA family transporter [Pseudoalteromonas piscicida]PCK32688.1 hypothetical protein CEX98_05555 [Pseudoalteromonas piscicida]
MAIALFSALHWAVFDFLRKRLASYYSAAQMSVIFSLLVLPAYVGYWLVADKQLPNSDYLTPAIASGILAAIGSVNFIQALALGRMAVILPLLSVTPALAGVFAWLLLGEPLTVLQACLIAVIVAASFLLQGGRFSFQEPGAKQVAITSVCWGLCIVFDKQALQYSSLSFHAGFLTFMVFVVNFICLRPQFKRQNFKRHGWLWVLSSLVFAAAVISQMQALTEIQPGLVEGLKRAIGIVSASMLGMWFFKEAISRREWLMIMVILLSSAMLAINSGA